MGLFVARGERGRELLRGGPVEPVLVVAAEAEGAQVGDLREVAVGERRVAVDRGRTVRVLPHVAGAVGEIQDLLDEVTHGAQISLGLVGLEDQDEEACAVPVVAAPEDVGVREDVSGLLQIHTDLVHPDGLGQGRLGASLVRPVRVELDPHRAGVAERHLRGVLALSEPLVVLLTALRDVAVTQLEHARRRPLDDRDARVLELLHLSTSDPRLDEDELELCRRDVQRVVGRGGVGRLVLHRRHLVPPWCRERAKIVVISPWFQPSSCGRFVEEEARSE